MVCAGAGEGEVRDTVGSLTVGQGREADEPIFVSHGELPLG